jgi:hypothetical protein
VAASASRADNNNLPPHLRLQNETQNLSCLINEKGEKGSGGPSPKIVND